MPTHIPPHYIVEAALLVSRWFEERNIHTWEIGNCRNRWARAGIPNAGMNLEVPTEWSLLPTVKGDLR